MTLEDIARRLDTIDTRLSTLEEKADDGFSAAEKQSMLSGFARLESKVDEGFNASKVRDEELHRLTKYGLEADEIMRDSIDRRLDGSIIKHDEQISLLRDVVRQNPAKR